MSASIVSPSPQGFARQAGLRYIGEEVPGLRRRRCGRGFRYLDPQGRALTDPAERDRIRALAIPPAWEEVWISPFHNAHILATGRDERGRKQYIYHPRWRELRIQGNFHQLIAFGEALPALRARIDTDLRRPGLPRERVLALVAHLLETTLIRVGNPEYARRNRSFGLTTMRARHLEVEGSRLHFEFRGKGGKPQRVDIRDRRAANLLRRCQELPGQELFQYLDRDGRRHCVDSGDINDYLSAHTGEEFTAKVFRTWGGSAMMVESLLETPPPASGKEAQARLKEAMKAAAEGLRNTVSVCRRHYVHPVIAAHYEAGSFHRLCREVEDGELHREENCLLRLLRETPRPPQGT